MKRRGQSPSDPTARRAYPEEALELLLEVLKTLSPRELGVVTMRFGLASARPRTQEEIGRVYGVTCVRIRQIESKTMSKLRSGAEGKVLFSPEDFGRMPEHIRERAMRRVREELDLGSAGQDPLVYCDRHGWTDPDYSSLQVCKSCPCRTTATVWNGRPRDYCSDACRQAAYRARQKERNSNRRTQPPA
ncbi:hypothetical protein GCM10009554_46420 [Kribbella koreensis]|uniref:RNA polymerase sigma-70 domain-containing protein n=1 Tax=Kribbella koreensis TaxID=57909 RepID=A0ABN1QXX3_9ACTN